MTSKKFTKLKVEMLTSKVGRRIDVLHWSGTDGLNVDDLHVYPTSSVERMGSGNDTHREAKAFVMLACPVGK